MSKKILPAPDAGPALTSFRCSDVSLRMLDDVVQWYTAHLLSSDDPEERKAALLLTKDKVLRTVLASFAKNRRIALSSPSVEKESA